MGDERDAYFAGKVEQRIHTIQRLLTAILLLQVIILAVLLVTR